jgi:hypothetical protein
MISGPFFMEKIVSNPHSGQTAGTSPLPTDSL